MRSQRPLRPCSRAVSPVVALCGLFPGGVETCPARAAEATSEGVAGKGRAHSPCHSERSEESVLSASGEVRRGDEDTDPSTPLRSAQDDNDGRLARHNYAAYPNDVSANPPSFYPASPGQAEPPAVHRLPQSTGQKPGPTSLDEKKRRNEK